MTKRPNSSWMAAALVAALAGVSLTALPRAVYAAEAGSTYSDAELQAVMTDDEAKITDLRNQELSALRITLGRRQPKNRMADLYFRLAELYLEAYRAEFLLEGRVHDRRRVEGKPAGFINRARSKVFLLSGVRACNEILSLRIAYNKLDRVYYFLGVNLLELEDRKEALKSFEYLTRKFPSSPFVSDAYRELGDSEFEKKEFAKAQAYYEMAVKREAGDTLPRLLHKLAWTYYRTRQFDRAVETMKEAISKTGKGGEKFVNLRDEALRDMAIFMTETGRVDEALTYFQQVAGDRNFFPRTLERLGRQYERNAEPAKAAQVYETLLKTYPDEEASFRVLVKLVDLDLRRGRSKDALARLKASKILTSGETDTETASQNLRAMIRRTATESHESFRKDASRPSLAVAEEFYSAYLNYFLFKSDPRKEIPEIQMYLAEVKRDLGKSKEASELYKRVLESGDKRYAKEAGALWTASLSEAIRKAAEGKTARTGNEPSKLEQEFIEAADDLQKNLGDLPEGREAALRAAQVLAGYKSTQDESITRIKKIVSKWPKSVQALTAARLWLQIHTDRLTEAKGTDKSAEKASQKTTEDLQQTLAKLRENTELMAADQESGQGKLKAQLADIDNRLRVGAIASAEKSKDYDLAAKGYEEYATTAAKREVAEKSYANAVGAYVKSGDYVAAERVLAAWQGRFKGSKPAQESLRSVATVALIQGKFEAAAGMFERLGSSGSDSESLETAARVFQGNGDATRARKVWSTYLNQYPRSPNRFTVALSLAQSFESERLTDEASKWYKYCLKGGEDFEAECGARLSDLTLKYRDRSQAKAGFRKVASIKGKQVSPFVGYARYRLAELMEQEANFDVLQLPEAQLKKSLNQRLDFLEPLSRAYQAAVDVGGPWGVAALDRLANWVFKFTLEVESIAPPTGASPAVVTQFQKSLASISGPLRKKAMETWSKAYQNAVQGEILSPALPGIVDHLADGRPTGGASAGVMRAQGFRGRFRIAGVPADGGTEGRTAALERVREKLTQNAQQASAWVDYGNLLWGEGKPLLSRIAYDRALALEPKSAAALNNRAVVHVSGTGEEDWSRAAEAQLLFRQALEKDDSFLPAKMNRGSLLNYYRIFSKAHAVWEQVSGRIQNPDAFDGLAVASQGLGQTAAADAAFGKATELGAGKKRFTKTYAEAARDASKCAVLLGGLDETGLGGFELESMESLKRSCSPPKGSP